MVLWTESHRHKTGFNNKFCECDNEISLFIKAGRSWLSKSLFQGRPLPWNYVGSYSLVMILAVVYKQLGGPLYLH
jgi:hypothetical protein